MFQPSARYYQRLLRQYLYFCTIKTSKVSVPCGAPARPHGRTRDPPATFSSTPVVKRAYVSIRRQTHQQLFRIHLVTSLTLIVAALPLLGKRRKGADEVGAEAFQRLVRQYLYHCTSKASKVRQYLSEARK
jgi:hypothetical protein